MKRNRENYERKKEFKSKKEKRNKKFYSEKGSKTNRLKETRQTVQKGKDREKERQKLSERIFSTFEIVFRVDGDCKPGYWCEKEGGGVGPLL